ncbi:MAG: phosphatase PAP2 family protein [Fidelibacterota bacterium]|nr:MAG: phosphatase PAP2 family protein [Candidatus Neomarinimicrobiota bacterium]
MKPVRHHFDRLILAYLGLIFLLTLGGAYYGFIYLVAAMTHLVMIIMVVRISGVSAQSGPRAWLRWGYPLLLLMPLHYEIELLGTLFHAGWVFDEVVKGWDRWLFRGHPHRYLADQLPGPWWREFFHLMYLTYYFIVLGGFLYAWKRGRHTAHHHGIAISPEFLRYVFIFFGTFCTYMLIFIFFPVVGPLDDRFLRFYGHGFIGPFIDWLYASGDSAGGAFPSSHIGEAVVIYLLLRPKSPLVRTASIVVIAGLTISTVYGSFHYGIDAATGLVSGLLFYLLWSWIYRKMRPDVPALSDTPGTEQNNEPTDL